MEIQIDLTEELNKKIQFYKIEHNLVSKEEAILQMLKEHLFKVIIK